MNIGFDAKRAFHNFTGLGNYSRTLIETLATYYPSDELHLFSPKPSTSPRVQPLLEAPSVSTHFPTGFWKKMPPVWRSYGIKSDIKAAKIDVFHGLSNELPLTLPPRVASVVTIHDLIFERYPSFYPVFDRFVYRQKFRRACLQADVVVAISEQTKQDIVDFYKIPESKIKVIYQSCHRQFYLNGKPTVDAQKTVVKRHNLPNDFFLYVGTINERKNLLGLVEGLKKMNDSTNLVVVGEGGTYFKKVKEYVVHQGLTNNVFYLPKVDFADLPALYAASRALVLPSFFEGFGIPIIEALWSGTPVITSVDSCFAEAGGDGALYINPSKSAEIAAAIFKIKTDETLRNALILRGGDFVQKFHEKHIAEQWHETYNELL